MRLSLLISLVARARARRMEAQGNLDDVEEVEALCIHMECRYMCPTLLRRTLYPN